MGYRHIIEKVQQRLVQLGIEPNVEFGLRLTPAQAREAQSKIPVTLPKCLISFFEEVGNGLTFSWQGGDLESDCPFANVEFLTLEAIVERILGEIENGFDDNYDFPWADDKEQARATARRMRKWIPLISEGNGDDICLDTGTAEHPIVFNEHETFFDSRCINGKVLAKNLNQFMKGWASVCFQFPKSFNWPAKLKDEGIDWKSSEFREPFRLNDDSTL